VHDLPWYGFSVLIDEITIQYGEVTIQIALDLFENKENTRSVLLHSSMFDAVIGQIKGELNSYC